ncbi:phosphate/phosphite/phosphonate ABC transporter substrate-binding protein [Bdellovibrio sp.]|uniref:phosphate/phosphite/phosphonate ABC transporter substrate-binding protein n=1 Tax=Bdellovibrio sp. TaxID=28201 RepID=UPI0039E53C05
MSRLVGFLVGVVLLGTLSCTTREEPLGSEGNPIKLHFVPSQEAKVLSDNSKILKKYLEEHTPYKFSVTIPQSYITVVEAFGTKRADVSALNTFGYILAHERYGAEARLTVVRYGSPNYQSQILAKADSNIKTIEDLQGKRVAFVDPASTSGYLLPLKALRDRGIKPFKTVFAMKHDSVISMIYQGQVDAGATFYTPPVNGKMDDARRLVLHQYPDVEEKIKIVALTEPIPNDPIVFRKDISEGMKTKIIAAFVSFVATPEGKKALDSIYGATDFKTVTDADYAVVREMLQEARKLNK